MCDPAELVRRLTDLGLTIATGESLTAGLVSASIADAPGASAVLRGGVVAYDPQVKVDLLGVDPDSVDTAVVSEVVALELARGARSALGADIGVGTTGVAGPDAHGGEPVGSVWIAVSTPTIERAAHLQLMGSREEIRRSTVAECLVLVLACLEEPA